jgi:hypothetical protein
MLYKLLFTFAILLASLNAPAQSPIRKAYTVAHRTGQATLMDGSHCSATAIAQHSLLTATHCELGTDLLFIDANATPTKILTILRDGHDHSIFIVSGFFTDYVPLDREAILEPGDSYFMWGNPESLRNNLRVGHFTGADAATKALPVKLLFDFRAYPGDSGAGIFDAKGNLIGVLTGTLYDGKILDMPFAFPLAFTKEQLQLIK